MSFKKANRIIKTFSNQRGVKIVKYNPNIHDILIKESWCKGYVSSENLNQYLNVYRHKTNVPERELSVDNKVCKKYINIYVATIIDNKELRVLGLIVWSKYESYDHYFSNVHKLKRIALKLSNDKFMKLSEKSGGSMTKTSLKSTKEEHDLEDLLLFDTGISPEFTQFKPTSKKPGEIAIVCVDPGAKIGIGRLLLTFAVVNMRKTFTSIMLTLGKKNNKHNSIMKRLVKQVGFRDDKTTLEETIYQTPNIRFEDETGTMQYMTFDDNYFKIEDILDLNRLDLGTFTCSKRKNGFTHAIDGSKYVEDGEWDKYCKCGNKGWSNPYSGNLSKTRMTTYVSQP